MEKNMKALITGGSGFIGSHLADLLIEKGYQVIVIDNLSAGRIENISHLLDNNNFEFFQVDILNFKEIRPLFNNINFVFHLAGMADIVPSIEKPRDYYDCNVTGTFNVLESSREAGVNKVVYAASSSSYGIPDKYPTSELSEIKPQYPYALTKHMGEELMLHWSDIYNIPTISLRLFNVYGPRSRTTGAYGAVFGVFLSQKVHKKPLTVVGDGAQTRDFTYVTDVAIAFLTAAESDIKNVSLNVGSGDHYSVNKLVELIGGEVVHIPKRPGEPDCTFADVTKISKLLNWKAQVGFEDGVNRILTHIDDWNGAPVWTPKSIKKATNAWFKYLGEK
jgi:UDP-glucose 4-epimerase